MRRERFASFARVRVLLLEDDQETAETLAQGLGQEGHEVSLAQDVRSALALVAEKRFDAAVLDLMVPGGSGYDVLEVLRKCEPRVPALLLTARSAVEDRVLGLDRGADDYLVKPFSFPELAARVRALGRRGVEQPSRLRSGELELDLLRHHARRRRRAARSDADRVLRCSPRCCVRAAMPSAGASCCAKCGTCPSTPAPTWWTST